MKLRIGTNCITKPNFVGEVVHETPKTVTVAIVELDFAPKTSKSGRLTHTFDTDQRSHLTGHFTGQTRKFWKESGREIGSNFSFLMGEC